MTSSRLILALSFLLIFLFGARPVSALDPSLDSLGGKIVHIYLPSDAIDTLILRNWSVTMTKTGKYWHTVTLKGDRYNSNQGFFFADPYVRHFLSKEGLSTSEKSRFNLADFQGKQEMWIIIDPSGPISAKPVILLEPPRIVNILNPWDATGPRLVLPYGKKTMSTVPGRCGWFMAFLLDPRDTKLHFEEVNDAATYGNTGLATPAVDYDIAAEFASKGIPGALGSNLWLDTDINSWLPAFPNKEGICQNLLAVTVRDFSAAHPDFDFGPITGDHTVLGIVQPTLGPDPGRKPVVNPANVAMDTAISFSQFDKWWITDSTNANPALRSYESCYDIPLNKTGDGAWEYDSFRDSPDHSFFPAEADNRNPGEAKDVCYFGGGSPPVFGGSMAGQKRNGNFCVEAHATFVYQRGQKVEFRGDDDVWAFIDNKLVMDLGGIHVPKDDTIDLDALNLVPGNSYNWDFFACDRQPCASTLKIKTTINFRQQRALEAVADTAKPGAYTIIKRLGLAGNCGGPPTDSAREATPVGLVYTLASGNGIVLDTLTDGTSYGGIRIQGAGVAFDMARISGLSAGRYTLSAYEAANSRVQAKMSFQVTEPPVALAKPRPAAARPSLGRRVHDILGRVFRTREQ